VEIIAGNRCSDQEKLVRFSFVLFVRSQTFNDQLTGSDGSDSVTWKLFVEQLHFTTPMIDRVVFGKEKAIKIGTFDFILSLIRSASSKWRDGADFKCSV
jgi:hypothetical protein